MDRAFLSIIVTGMLISVSSNSAQTPPSFPSERFFITGESMVNIMRYVLSIFSEKLEQHYLSKVQETADHIAQSEEVENISNHNRRLLSDVLTQLSKITSIFAGFKILGRLAFSEAPKITLLNTINTNKFNLTLNKEILSSLAQALIEVSKESAESETINNPVIATITDFITTYSRALWILEKIEALF
ncbi:MAG: hypothetical protein JW725_04000 [Candidatus Babeliaceae bacterium]|nr:hypothetical protein [Candidatus Babeliaceae bacterium]